MATAPDNYDNVFTRRARAAGIEEGQAEGRAEGRAAIVLRILDRRGIQVPASARARITGSSDLEQLDRWADRAVDATSIDDLFSHP